MMDTERTSFQYVLYKIITEKKKKKLTCKQCWEYFQEIFSELLDFYEVTFKDTMDEQGANSSAKNAEYGYCKKDGKNFIGSDACNCLMSGEPKKVNGKEKYLQVKFLNERFGPYITDNDFEYGFSNADKKLDHILEKEDINLHKANIQLLIDNAKWKFDEETSAVLKKILSNELLKGDENPALLLLLIISLYPTQDSLLSLFTFLNLKYPNENLHEWIHEDKVICPYVVAERKINEEDSMTSNLPAPSLEASISDSSYAMNTTLTDSSAWSVIKDTAMKMQKRAYDNCRLLPYSESEDNRMKLPTLNVETTVSDMHSSEIELLDVIRSAENNIMITGSGGCGKTYSLLYCANQILSNDDRIIPFYIPLNIFNSYDFNGIEHYIIDKLKANYYNEFSKAEKEYNTFLSDCEGTGIKIFFFCDGFNEVVSKELQGKIIRDIKELQHNSLYRFVITSRYNLSSTFAEFSGSISNVGFSAYKVNDLRDGDVIKYVRTFFNSHNISESETDRIINKELCESRTELSSENGKIKSIFKTPMAIVMFCGLHSTDRYEVANPDFYNSINRLGELIHDFILCVKYGNKSENKDKAYDLLQYIGYRMNIDGVFTISKAVFGNYCNDFVAEFPEFCITADAMWNDSFVNDIMKKDNSTINVISFNHQNFRDYFAAAFLHKFISNESWNCIKRFIGIDKKIPNETSILLAELLGEYKAIGSIGYVDTSIQKLFNDSIKVKDDDSCNLAPSAVAYLVNLAKIGRENNLSQFDFTGLDLSLTRLNSVVLSDGRPGNNRRHAIFNNSTINKDTFAPVGHAGAPLVMFYVENRYILSFSKNTICSFDMNTGVQGVVAEYSEEVILSGVYIEETNSIITGDTGGILSLWKYEVINDHLTLSLIKQLDLLKCVYMFATKERRKRTRVQSICHYVNDQILFSLNCGDVFSVDTELKTNPALKISLCPDDTGYSKFSCINSLGENFYVSYGNKIFKNNRDNCLSMPEDTENGCIYDFVLMENEDCVSLIVNFRGDKNNSNGTKSILYKFNELLFDEDGEIEKIREELHSSSSQGFKGWNNFSALTNDSLSLYLCANITDDIFTPGVYKLTFEPIYDDDGEIIDITANGTASYEPIFGNRHIMSVECVLPFVYKGKQYLATSSTDRSVEVMDVSSTENLLLYRLPGHTDGVTCMKVIDDSTIYTCHYSGEVCKWRKIKNKWKCTVMAKPHTNWVWAVDVAYDELNNAYIVGASYDHNISLTDSVTGEYRLLKGCKGNIKTFEVVGNRIITAYDYKENGQTKYEIGIFDNIFDKDKYNLFKIMLPEDGYVRCMCQNNETNTISLCANSAKKSYIFNIEVDNKKLLGVKYNPVHCIDYFEQRMQMRSLDSICYNNKTIYVCVGNAGSSYAEIWDEQGEKFIFTVDRGFYGETDGFSTVKFVVYNGKLFIVIGSFDHYIYVYEIIFDSDGIKAVDIADIQMTDKVMNVQYFNEHIYASLFNGKVVSWCIKDIVESQCDFIVEESAELLFQAKSGLHIMDIDFTKCNNNNVPEDFKKIMRYYSKI